MDRANRYARYRNTGEHMTTNLKGGHRYSASKYRLCWGTKNGHAIDRIAQNGTICGNETKLYDGEGYGESKLHEDDLSRVRRHR